MPCGHALGKIWFLKTWFAHAHAQAQAQAHAHAHAHAQAHAQENERNCKGNERK